MANEKQYLEVFNDGQDDLYIRDQEAQEELSQIPTIYATKAALTAATLIPVNLDDMTPWTTFVKNNILAINGVQYRAKKDTTHFPVVLLTDGGQFVVNVVNGAPAYVISDYTLDADWEIWGDAGIPQTLANMQQDLDDALADLSRTAHKIQEDCDTTLQQIQTSAGQAVSEIEADQAEFINEATSIVGQSLKSTSRITTSDGQTQYTVQQLLTAMADLMGHTVVVHPGEQ